MTNLDSSELERIRESLRQAGLGFVDELVIVAAKPDEFVVLVPEERIRKRATRGVTSERQLGNLMKQIESSLGVSVGWVRQRSEDWRAIERSLQKLLELRFPELVESVILSSPDQSPVTVWVSAARTELLAAEEEVEREITSFLKRFDVAQVDVVILATRRVLSSAALLRRLKELAPATAREVEAALAKQGFDLSAERALANPLDTLRRRGLVNRSRDGLYSLTEAGLRAVPHGASRTSSDLERVLALGRRKW